MLRALSTEQKRPILLDIFWCCPKEVPVFIEELHKQKGQMKQNEGTQVYIFSANIDAFILPAFLFYCIPYVFPPPTESFCRNYRWDFSLWQALPFV